MSIKVLKSLAAFALGAAVFAQPRWRRTSR